MFGKDDSGRYAKKKIAAKAVSDMLSLQPPTTQGVFYFPPDFEDAEITPDVVVLSVRPVELCRLIQGYQFLTGKRVRADVGGLRAGCSDLIVRPYLSGKSTFLPIVWEQDLSQNSKATEWEWDFRFRFLKSSWKERKNQKPVFHFPDIPAPAHRAGDTGRDDCRTSRQKAIGDDQMTCFMKLGRKSVWRPEARMDVFNRTNSRNSGRVSMLTSWMLISPRNAKSRNLSLQISEVPAGSEQPIHNHEPEQCYYIIKGNGLMGWGTGSFLVIYLCRPPSRILEGKGVVTPPTYPVFRYEIK